jgi:hypothetical protein
MYLRCIQYIRARDGTLSRITILAPRWLPNAVLLRKIACLGALTSVYAPEDCMYRANASDAKKLETARAAALRTVRCPVLTEYASKTIPTNEERLEIFFSHTPSYYYDSRVANPT